MTEAFFLLNWSNKSCCKYLSHIVYNYMEVVKNG